MFFFCQFVELPAKSLPLLDYYVGDISRDWGTAKNDNSAWEIVQLHLLSINYRYFRYFCYFPLISITSYKCQTSKSDTYLHDTVNVQCGLIKFDPRQGINCFTIDQARVWTVLPLAKPWYKLFYHWPSQGINCLPLTKPGYKLFYHWPSQGINCFTIGQARV